MKIATCDIPFFAKLYTEWWHSSSEDSLKNYLIHTYNLHIEHELGQLMYFIFDSEQDYFLALMQLS